MERGFGQRLQQQSWIAMGCIDSNIDYSTWCWITFPPETSPSIQRCTTPDDETELVLSTWMKSGLRERSIRLLSSLILMERILSLNKIFEPCKGWMSEQLEDERILGSFGYAMPYNGINESAAVAYWHT